MCAVGVMGGDGAEQVWNWSMCVQAGCVQPWVSSKVTRKSENGRGLEPSEVPPDLEDTPVC